MPEVQMIARWTLDAGQAEEVLDLLSEIAEATRAEPGNLSFEIYRQVDDPLEVVLLERYASRQALAAHRETPHFQELVLARAVPRLVDRVLEVFDADDV